MYKGKETHMEEGMRKEEGTCKKEGMCKIEEWKEEGMCKEEVMCKIEEWKEEGTCKGEVMCKIEEVWSEEVGMCKVSMKNCSLGLVEGSREHSLVGKLYLEVIHNLVEHYLFVDSSCYMDCWDLGSHNIIGYYLFVGSYCYYMHCWDLERREGEGLVQEHPLVLYNHKLGIDSLQQNYLVMLNYWKREVEGHDWKVLVIFLYKNINWS